MADVKVTIDQIKEVRARTGSGLMDCKNALIENGADVDKACDWLREKGIAKQAKQAATRTAAEGMSNVAVFGNKAVILEINCETDFVATNALFKDLVKKVTGMVLAAEPKTIEDAMAIKDSDGNSVKDLFLEIGMKIGEKLDFRRFDIVEKTDDEVFGPYLHMGGKIATLVVLKGGDAETANGIALNVCSLNPAYKSMDEIPAATIAKETDIELEASRQDEKFAKKPEAIQKKIVEGRVKKSLGESVLTEEPYVLDESQTVGSILKSKKATVVATYRYQTGEGIEVKKTDYAKEVADQIAAAKKN